MCAFQHLQTIKDQTRHNRKQKWLGYRKKYNNRGEKGNGHPDSIIISYYNRKGNQIEKREGSKKRKISKINFESAVTVLSVWTGRCYLGLRKQILIFDKRKLDLIPLELNWRSRIDIKLIWSGLQVEGESNTSFKA